MTSPARRYSWPPFEKGNELSPKRSGAWSPRTVDPIAAELVEFVVAVRPDLAEPRHALVVWAWARAEAQCAAYAAWFAEHDTVTDKGDAPGVVAWDRVERRADALRQRLGLDPVSEAALRKTQADATSAAFDVEALMAAGRAAIEARASSTDDEAAVEA